MVEARESFHSGVRVAPRYFATGEAVDGPRIFYNFMRPTFDAHQLALELEGPGPVATPAWSRAVPETLALGAPPAAEPRPGHR
jgi:hypothetical protein